MNGLERGKVKVADYDPAWPKKYAAEAEQLRDSLGNLVADIQHIGSTAVPGLAAKPIIDIAVAVADIQAVDALVGPLEALGYEYRGLLAGIEGHHFFRRGNPREFFLHVFEAGGDFWRRRIAFRDYLIAHPDVAAEYATLKERLAREYADDRSSYTAEKKAFIGRVTDVALRNQESASLRMIPEGRIEG